MVLYLSRVCVFVSARRRDAPAAAQGLSEGRVREGQRGGQKPGHGCLRPPEAPAVRLTAPATHLSTQALPSATSWTGLGLWDLITFSGPTISVGNISNRSSQFCFFLILDIVSI